MGNVEDLPQAVWVVVGERPCARPFSDQVEKNDPCALVKVMPSIYKITGDMLGFVAPFCIRMIIESVSKEVKISRCACFDRLSTIFWAFYGRVMRKTFPQDQSCFLKVPPMCML